MLNLQGGSEDEEDEEGLDEEDEERFDDEEDEDEDEFDEDEEDEESDEDAGLYRLSSSSFLILFCYLNRKPRTFPESVCCRNLCFFAQYFFLFFGVGLFI